MDTKQINLGGEIFQAVPEVKVCQGCAFHEDSERDRCDMSMGIFDCIENEIIWQKVGVKTGSVLQKENETPVHVDAAEILEEAAATIRDRAASRDMEKERSMARCVKAFNVMTGHNLSETDGWLFMQYLKHSRSQGGAYRYDDYIDDVAYAALKAESAAKEFASEL